jgi:hypothetical protein
MYRFVDEIPNEIISMDGRNLHFTPGTHNIGLNDVYRLKYKFLSE